MSEEHTHTFHEAGICACGAFAPLADAPPRYLNPDDNPDVFFQAEPAEPVIVTMACKPCGVQMNVVAQSVAEDGSGMVAYMHQCPTCKSTQVAPLAFPMQRWQPKKVIVGTPNGFRMPPRGRH